MAVFITACHWLAVTVYSADMPQRLPLYDIVSGLLKSVGKALKYWFHYTLVAIAWLGVVPLTACKYPTTLFLVIVRWTIGFDFLVFSCKAVCQRLWKDRLLQTSRLSENRQFQNMSRLLQEIIDPTGTETFAKEPKLAKLLQGVKIKKVHWF